MRWPLVLLLSFSLLGLVLPASAAEVPDDEIHDTLRIKLAGDRDVRGTQIEVIVEEGVVTLRGEVFRDKAKKRAEKMAKKHKGVKKVINELTVAPK